MKQILIALLVFSIASCSLIKRKVYVKNNHPINFLINYPTPLTI